MHLSTASCKNPWPRIEKLYCLKSAVNQNLKFQCLLCNPKLVYISTCVSSNSNLRKHIKRIHPQHLEEFNFLCRSLKRVASTRSPALSQKQMRLKALPSLTNYDFSSFQTNPSNTSVNVDTSTEGDHSNVRHDSKIEKRCLVDWKSSNRHLSESSSPESIACPAISFCAEIIPYNECFVSPEIFETEEMSHSSSKRSYEERTSSYRRQFGDGNQRFSYSSQSPSRNVSSSSSHVYKYASTSGASQAPNPEPARATSSSSNVRVRTSRTIPVTSGVSMQDINVMSDTLGPDFQGMRVNEKEELKSLNTKLAGYIQKVRALEQANQILEAQMEQVNASQSSHLTEMYEEELTRLRREVDSINHQKANLQLQLDNATAEAAKWKQKYDDEAENNRELESDLSGMRKDCDDATLVRLDLERRLETLQEEIEFLKNIHEQEIIELQDRVRKSDVKIEPAPVPDLEELLEDMRMQYEKLAARNKADAEQWYQDKVENLQQQSAKNDDQMRQVRTEISEYRKTVQTLNLEIDSLRGTNDSLQRALSDLEQRGGKDAKDYQETIDALKSECDDLKSQMAQNLRQYQELMDVKMALDIELATYRKLLEGEESRLSDKMTTTPSGGMAYRPASACNFTSYSRPSAVDDVETVTTTKKVVVKTIETKDGKVISQTEDVREHSSGDHD